jgi:Ca2+-binding RTX toxin-like protein
MSKPIVKYHPIPDGMDWLVVSTITQHSPSKVVSVNAAQGIRQIFTGEDLKVVNGVIAEGTIEGLVIKDSNNHPLIEFRNISFDISTLNPTSMDQAVFNTWFLTVIGGANYFGTRNGEVLEGYGSANDWLHGLGGADTLAGNGGNDRLYGGKGSDVFVFEADWGKDRIMDFDASGGPGRQDLINADPAEIINKYRDGSNTVLDFGNGDILTLGDVKPSQISDADFMI